MGTEPIHVDEAIERHREPFTIIHSAGPLPDFRSFAWIKRTLHAFRDGRIVTDDKARADQAEQALRNVAAACNQLEGYSDLPRERQVELVQAIRRFTGVERSVLRAAEGEAS